MHVWQRLKNPDYDFNQTNPKHLMFVYGLYFIILCLIIELDSPNDRLWRSMGVEKKLEILPRLWRFLQSSVSDIHAIRSRSLLSNASVAYDSPSLAICWSFLLQSIPLFRLRGASDGYTKDRKTLEDPSLSFSVLLRIVVTFLLRSISYKLSPSHLDTLIFRLL